MRAKGPVTRKRATWWISSTQRRPLPVSRFLMVRAKLSKVSHLCWRKSQNASWATGLVNLTSLHWDTAPLLWPYISPIIKPLGKTFPLTGTYLHFICGTQANPTSSVRPSLNHRPHLVPFLKSHSILYFFLVFMKVVTEKLCNYRVSVSLVLGASFRQVGVVFVLFIAESPALSPQLSRQLAPN